MPTEMKLNTHKETDMEVIGDLIRTRRQACGLSVYQLARAVGTRKDYLEAIEDGEEVVSRSQALRICDVLDVKFLHLDDGKSDDIVVIDPVTDDRYYVTFFVEVEEEQPRYYMTLEDPKDAKVEEEPEKVLIDPNAFVVSHHTIRQIREEGPNFTDRQRFWLVDLAREMIEDRHLDEWVDGVTEFLSEIFNSVQDDATSELLAYASGALPRMNEEINTEAVNDVQEAPKPYCVVIRNRETLMIQEVIGPVTYDDAHLFYEDYKEDKTFQASLFHLNVGIHMDPAGTTKSSI